MAMMKFWPRNKDVAILSETTLDMLQLRNVIEIEDERRRVLLNCYEEDVLKLIINKNKYEIPKYITSRGTLAFLGFTKSKVKVLWQYLNSLNLPLDEAIASYEAYLFWEGVKAWLDLECNKLAIQYKNNDIIGTKQFLDGIGLTTDVQHQRLKVTYEGKKSEFIYLDKQDMPWVIQWVKRYIKRRWSILINMDFNINHKPINESFSDIVMELNDKPVGSEIAYTTEYHEPLLDIGPTPLKSNFEFNDQNSNKEDSNGEDFNEEYFDKELSDIEVSEDLFKW